jgi:hypothetical protein
VSHPLRYLIPPLVVVLAVLAAYLPMHRHAVAKRERPHEHRRDPISHATAASIVAAALIVAFISAFILP